MVDELKRYWFVAAVFREPHDLVATIVALRENGFAANRLLIVANQRAEDMRGVVDGSERSQVPVIAAQADGTLSLVPFLEISVALRRLLAAMNGEGAPGGDLGDAQSHVYAQLRQDVAAGALILIASVADPDEQLLGARMLLRGNCECVLTHEIAA